MSIPALRPLGAVVALLALSAGAKAAPAARFGDLDACRIVSPTFVPSAPKTPAAGLARFLGGATVKRPVAAPCPRGPHPFDV